MKTNQGISKFDCSSWSYDDCKIFCEVDYWDTLEHLNKTRWTALLKSNKATFKENTKLAIWSLNATFLGALEQYEKLSDTSFQTKVKLANLFELYLLNRKTTKKKGKKVIKWIVEQKNF